VENSEVLEQDTNVVPDGKEQKDVAAIDEGPELIKDVNKETTTPNTGEQTQQTTVAEPDHATAIASAVSKPTVLDQDTGTYGYNSQAGKEYDETVTTTTTQSNGSNPLSTTWDSKYKMESGYTVDDSQDYSWNKLASEMAQLTYDQEATQYRADMIAAKQELDAAASSAWNNYFAAEYSARQTQEKMGWSGGQEKASDLQVMFLQAETAANMYTQDEMQKYGMESKLSIARMYADANQRALALEYYQNELDKAVQEANLTGYYVPPEAKEMFTQEKLAKDIINNPASTQEAVDRAKKVIANCEAYYKNLGFEKGTRKDEKTGKVVTEWRGIKTLATLTYEETVRNNKIIQDLQRQANEINQQNANTAKLQYQLAKANSLYVPVKTNALESKKIFEKGNIVGKDATGLDVYKYNGKTYVQRGTDAFIYAGDISKPTSTQTTATSDALKKIITDTVNGLKGNDLINGIYNVITNSSAFKNATNMMKRQYAIMSGMSESEAKKRFP
jgi:hypothetical protein